MAQIVDGKDAFGFLEFQPVLSLGQWYSASIVGFWVGLRNRKGLLYRLDRGRNLVYFDRAIMVFLDVLLRNF